MDKKKLDEILKKHQKWLDNEPDGEQANLQEADLRWADLREANLQGADLRGASLQGADLRGASLFNTCLPLWCGGLHIKLDRLQMAQLAYHFCSMDCEDDEIKSLQKSLYKLANDFADSREDLQNNKYEVDNE